MATYIVHLEMTTCDSYEVEADSLDEAKEAVLELARDNYYDASEYDVDLVENHEGEEIASRNKNRQLINRASGEVIYYMCNRSPS